jgi:hypothetical protein
MTEIAADEHALEFARSNGLLISGRRADRRPN